MNLTSRLASALIKVRMRGAEYFETVELQSDNSVPLDAVSSLMGQNIKVLVFAVCIKV